MPPERQVNEPAAEYAADPSRSLAIQRFAGILDRLPAGDLDELAGLDDAGFLSRLEEQVMAQAVPQSAMARARARGQAARKQLFKSADVMTIEQAAELLGIKPESVGKKIQRGQLLIIEFGDQKFLPSFQFREDRVEPEMTALMQALEPLGAFTRLDWFLSPHPDFDNQRPADLIGSRSEGLLQAARRFGNQGGA